MTRAGLALALALLAACSSSPPPPVAARPSGAPAAQPATPAPTPTAAPTPPLPAYYIESLRARDRTPGKLQVGDQMFRGDGFGKYQMSWPSGGQTMTGTISLPDGPGPFPVLVVNHGYIPASRYWVGQDSGIFGDPLAAHGFISVAPNWPGYAGSGPAPADLPAMLGEVVITLDLISALATLPQADLGRIAVAGHSNGGGISEIAMVVDPRIRAVVLFAPVSSDMADNARKWWLNSGQANVIGRPEDNPEGYRHISPRNYFAAGQPPTLIIQGTADHDIPAAWTQATYDALQSKGVKSRLVWVPGADHDMVGADLEGAVAQEEDWLRQNL